MLRYGTGMEGCNPVFKPLFHTSIPSILILINTRTRTRARTHTRAHVCIGGRYGRYGRYGRTSLHAPFRVPYLFHTSHEVWNISERNAIGTPINITRIVPSSAWSYRRLIPKSTDTVRSFLFADTAKESQSLAYPRLDVPG